MIFPGVENVANGSNDIYKRSHGSFAPGEKMSRGYDWHGMDLDKKVFGVKGTSTACNGVSTNVADALQDEKVSANTEIKVRYFIYFNVMKKHHMTRRGTVSGDVGVRVSIGIHLELFRTSNLQFKNLFLLFYNIF